MLYIHFIVLADEPAYSTRRVRWLFTTVSADNTISKVSTVS